MSVLNGLPPTSCDSTHLLMNTKISLKMMIAHVILIWIPIATVHGVDPCDMEIHKTVKSEYNECTERFKKTFEDTEKPNLLICCNL